MSAPARREASAVCRENLPSYVLRYRPTKVALPDRDGAVVPLGHAHVEACGNKKTELGKARFSVRENQVRLSGLEPP